MACRLVQCWNIVNSYLRNKFKWNLILNSCIFIQVVLKMAAILSQAQYVNIAAVAIFCQCSGRRLSFLESQWFSRIHEDVIKWKHFPRHWPFVRGIHRSPVNSPHTKVTRSFDVFFDLRIWISGWVNNGEAGDLRRHCAYYDVIVMHYLMHTCLV